MIEYLNIISLIIGYTFMTLFVILGFLTGILWIGGKILYWMGMYRPVMRAIQLEFTQHRINKKGKL